MYDSLIIDSHKGKYGVSFNLTIPPNIDSFLPYKNCCYIIDENIAKIYQSKLSPILKKKSTIIINSNEEAKSLEKLSSLFERLTKNEVRRDSMFIAIGGGVVQDITCFISSVFLRGVPWIFIPTTLLSQADSCIGSKSSINIKSAKNILGTFNPPKKVFIWAEFLNTLSDSEIRSGVGEIIKVCAIDGMSSFRALSADLQDIYCDQEVLLRYIHKSLNIKKNYVELDEFDRNQRNIFNYGHSFGHAIEFATNYLIPHGVAVTIGMDLANFLSAKLGYTSIEYFNYAHPTLAENANGHWHHDIPVNLLFDALLRDKKNTQTELGLIFPVGPDAKISKLHVPMSPNFKSHCIQYFEDIYGSSN